MFLHSVAPPLLEDNSFDPPGPVVADVTDTYTVFTSFKNPYSGGARLKLKLGVKDGDGNWILSYTDTSFYVNPGDTVLKYYYYTAGGSMDEFTICTDTSDTRAYIENVSYLPWPFTIYYEFISLEE